MSQQTKVLARYMAILDQTKNSWASATEETKNGTKYIGDLSKTIKFVVSKNGEPRNLGCEQIYFVC